MDRLRDRLWIWGHPTNSLYKAFGLNEPSSMSPMEGMGYLGARNLFYVPMRRPTHYAQCNRAMEPAREVGWSVETPDMVDTVIEQAHQFPNIRRAVFDDFFSDENASNNSRHYPPEKLADLRHALHTKAPHPLEMWMVLYTHQFDRDIARFIDEFDGVSMWIWNESDVVRFEQHCATFFDLTPKQKRLIGCYLYDFGGEKQASAKRVRDQLDRNREFILQGDIEGVILHTNAVADLGYEAVEAAKSWVLEHGDERVPDYRRKPV